MAKQTGKTKTKTIAKAKATTKAKTKATKLSRGQRTHVRRVKEEARRSGTTYRAPFGVTRAAVTPKKDEAPK